ncbi:hypothetical protein PFISCL1PPCAC_21276 [Pristionchus fissidentatus]|uniref:BTB domain-containing protein n=1 Tax=Pristionchus fissidentatus TaxID=1538716 RepID=A0AAV5WH46_9BILA|nr:hypothetical protein PFISCL1PPCAC_21276 [Pristionchus fissidentatus]
MTSNPDLVIRMDIQEVSKLSDTGIFSDAHYVKDLPWKLKVRSETSERTGNVKALGVYLCCNEESESPQWSCDYSFEAVAVNINPTDNKVYKLTNKFNILHTLRGPFALIVWDDLVDPEKGFIKDDRVTVEGRVFIHMITGIRKLNLMDYSNSADSKSNVVLVVQGKKLHVSKEFLSIHSPVFSTMFFGNFTEKNQEEIELNDVEYKEFVDLLNVIYPTMVEIDRRTVSHILKLADRYQMVSALERAESYLIKTTRIERLAKLVLADQYRLDILMAHTLALYMELATLKALKSTRTSRI